ncbi:MAG TPA: Gfo/Idh/MocA family oxidoreductase [Luteolibacter sp.]|nr:Gfo/Idh/MocA family oxidoreductase [Luteolibacter sp.]
MSQDTPTPSHPSPFPRRSFLKGALILGSGACLTPQLLLAQKKAAKGLPDGEKVKIAFCGIGFRGGQIAEELFATGMCEVVALCDTAMEAPHTQKLLKMFPTVPRFRDFREMFEKMGDKIEAVSVGTPDHSHFPIAMLAMSLGKHVYVEKPMAHSFKQIQLMMDAEKKYKVACQMGNQGHSMANYFQFKAWTEAGVIKNVKRVDAFMNSARRWHGKKYTGFFPEEPVPEYLNHDVWTGTAKLHPYNKGYMDGEWRCWFDYGNGALGDWGAHIFDTAHEFLKLGLPTSVEPVRLDGYSEFVFPQECTLKFHFPEREGMPACDLNWYEGQNNPPPLPTDFGDAVVDGNIPPPSTGKIDTKKMPPGKVIYAEGFTLKGGSHGSTLQFINKDKAKDLKLPPVESGSNHFENFFLACKGKEKTRSNFAVAGPLCQAMALGVIAQRVKGKIEFDPASRKITNNEAANALLDGDAPRKEWEKFYSL